MNVKERLKKFIKSQNLKISDFEKSINASNGYINSISKGIGVDKLELIIENYPILNIEWLLTGNGSMLKDIPSVSLGAEAERDESELISKLRKQIEGLERELEMQRGFIETQKKLIEMLEKQSERKIF